jgi:hypothetical protein
MNDIIRAKKFIEALAKGDKTCRGCHHKKFEHLKDVCLAVFGNEDTLSKCRCKEFVPLDNLDYIEWLAKKRGLV